MPVCKLPFALSQRVSILCAPFEHIRISSENVVEIKVFRGCRPPRHVSIPGTLLPVGKSSGHLSPEICFTKIRNLVCLTGHMQGSPEGGFRELASRLPSDARPNTDLEFLVPHGSSVAKVVVYADGRVVVDPVSASSDMLAESCLTGKVFFSTNEEPEDDNQFVSVQQIEPNLIKVTVDSAVSYFQGKITSSESRLFQLRETVGGEHAFVIGNRLTSMKPDERTAIVKISGTQASLLDQESNGIVRVWSLSGVSWMHTLLPRTGFFLPQSLFLDKTECVSAVAEGIGDYCARTQRGSIDIEKLSAEILLKKCPPNSREGRSGWISKLVSRYSKTVTTNESLESVSMGIAKQTLTAFESSLLKLKKIITAPENGPVVNNKIAKRPIRQRFLGSSQRQYGESMADWLRMNGSRKCRHQIDLVKNASEEELLKLREIIIWFNSWSASDKYLTHSSLMGNQDIFTDTGKWVIPDDAETQSILFKYMAWIYKRGYDTFISEIQTPLFPLIEDLDMESTIPLEDTSQIDSIFMDEALLFVKERARILHYMYPSHTELTVYIYSSSGFNKSKGRWKSSFHLVWPDLIVHGELAPIIRQSTVEYFVYKSRTTRYFGEMQKRLVNNYEANIWENVFDQTTSNANNGLRMPFCNKASWVKNQFGIRIPSVENRRCYPKGTVVIKFEPRKFPDIESETSARTRAMDLIAQAEKLGHHRDAVDQNDLVGDRTQYKQADRNTINRTSAFVAAMRSQGGDMREFVNVQAQWAEKILDPESLSDAEVAKWIQRGSCRRASAVLSEYNKEFVNCYLQADLVWFEGFTLETLRESEHYRKLTPAGQQGLKNRFRKYLDSRNGGLTAPTHVGGTSDVEKLKNLALHMRQRLVSAQTTRIDPIVEEQNHDSSSSSHGFDDETAPPVEDEQDQFDLWPNVVENIFSFHESMEMWKDTFSAHLSELNMPHGGYWIKASSAIIWISPRIGKPLTDGFNCGLPVMRSACGRKQVTATLYHQCGKVVVTGNRKSPEFKAIISIVKRIATPDDRLYHKLQTTADWHDMLVSFPLIDRAGARNQREEFEQRWKIMESIESDSRSVEPLAEEIG